MLVPLTVAEARSALPDEGRAKGKSRAESPLSPLSNPSEPKDQSSLFGAYGSRVAVCVTVLDLR